MICMRLRNRRRSRLPSDARSMPSNRTLAAGRFDQPQDCPAGGRLAAAAFADEAERLAAVDVEADAVDGADVIDRPAEEATPDGEMDLRFSTARSGRVFSATHVVSAARGVCSHGWPIAASSDFGCSSAPRPSAVSSRKRSAVIFFSRIRISPSIRSTAMKSSTVGRRRYFVSSRGRQASRPFV